ncbi:MAG TPA: type II toxin-antitoxin system HicA family toxin [Polyangia bacterium]|nr:type II toxin-antitoxin system HicA family toxin [Polyangia bacterium]
MPRVGTWPASRARLVVVALRRLGWVSKRQTGSHRTLARPGWPDFIFAFHEADEIGPRMLARVARVAKRTGLRPDDLR